MDMYVRMYDDLKRTEGDNPTLGIVLCSETDQDIAKYSILNGNSIEWKHCGQAFGMTTFAKMPH